MRIGGLILDFNGVLVDDERVHFDAFQKALEGQGLTLSWEEYCETFLHYDDQNFFSNFLEHKNRQADPQKIQELIQLKSGFYFEKIQREVPVIGSSVAFVRGLPQQVLLAIASGAARSEIEFILDYLQLSSRFSVIVSASDVINGKPHPETFLKALAQLREDKPELTENEVLVIEDSYRGVQSAHAAGMRCLALTTSYPPERFQQADLVLESLQGWTLQTLEQAL